MNDAAMAQLADLLGTYGAHLCKTPGACAMMLRTKFIGYPSEKEALIRTLEAGAVDPLLARPGEEARAAAVEKASRAGQGFEEARWAVAAWSEALRASTKASALLTRLRHQEAESALVAQDNGVIGKVVAAACLVAVGLFLAAGACLMLKQEHLFNGARAEGKVVGFVEREFLQRSRRWTTRVTKYAPVIEYRVKGSVYEVQSTIWSEDPEYQTGESVPVLYLPNRPGSAEIADYNHLYLLPVVLASLGVAALVFLGVFFMTTRYFIASRQA